MWYLWYLTVLYSTKLVFPVQAMSRRLIDPTQAHSLLWTLFEWFSPLSWWRKQLNLIINHHYLNLLSDQEGEQFTSIFIIHSPYFKHPITKLFWTQDQAYEWKTVPHSFPLTHDCNLVSTLKNYLIELNHVQPTPTNIQHISLGPHHELIVIPTSKMPLSSHSPSTGILIKEERPDYTNILFQDSQDPWEEFTSILHSAETPGASSTSPVPQTSPIPLIDSPTRQYDAHLPWWKEPFVEVDSDVDNLSPSHNH